MNVGTSGLVAVIALAVGLSGCGAASVEQDTTAKVSLDYAHTRIISPITEYELSPEEQLVISRARERAFGLCMIPKGFAETPPKAVADDEDRDFGLWNVANAKKYGYGFAPQDTVAIPETDVAWQQARTECLSSQADVVAAFTPPEGDDNSVRQLASDALALAFKDSKWSEYRSSWKQCLTDKGLEPPTSDFEMISKQGKDILSREDPVNPSAADKESEIRIAVIEATCNQDTSLTQNLGDLVAGYEAPLVRKNVALLSAAKQKNADYVRAATVYLSSH